MHKIKTPNMNTKILARLALRAFIKIFDSPIYGVSFKILKTRSSLKAFKAIKLLLPMKNKDRYFGSVDIKSMIP